MRTDIETWILQNEDRPNVKAINIGLMQTQKGYSAYLIGSNEYDPENDDWACNEDYVPTDKYLELPLSKSLDWDVLQERVVKIIINLIQSKNDSILNYVENVTVGFDNGELIKVK